MIVMFVRRGGVPKKVGYQSLLRESLRGTTQSMGPMMAATQSRKASRDDGMLIPLMYR